MEFDLRQLEIFCKVAELRSFSKAARAVRLTQPTVSEHIASLEDAVGAKLFDRLGREVVLTRSGELFHRYARQFMSLKEETRQAFDELLGVGRGEIQIGASTIPGEYILPRIIGRFRHQYPQIAVRVLVADTETIVRGVVAGECELGIVGSHWKMPHLVLQPLWDDELVLAVPAGHPWARRRQVSVQELLGEPFILRESGSGTRCIMEEALRGSGISGARELNVVAEFGSSTAVKEGIIHGVGVSVLSVRAVEAEVKAGVLAALSIRGLDLKRSFYLARDSRRSISPLCKAFLEFLEQSRA